MTHLSIGCMIAALAISAGASARLMARRRRLIVLGRRVGEVTILGFRQHGLGA